MRKAGSLDAQQLEMMETFEVEAARMGSLVTRFLRVAQLGHEDVNPRMEVIDVASVVMAVVKEYQRLSLDRRIAFEPVEGRTPTWPPNRPETHEGPAEAALLQRRSVVPASSSNDSPEALADAELLGLALSQLMDNACKYSLPGSEISVALESKDGMIFIRVANSGSSIPESERSRIFERFYRGEEARRFTSGAGLGLYVARKIAFALGGKLDLDLERPGESVAFSLSLPKAAGEPENSNTQ
jgi:signal transduction histidine kinase